MKKMRKLLITSVLLLVLTALAVCAASCYRANSSRRKADEHLGRGLSLMYEGKYEEAISEYNTAIDLYPLNPTYLYYLSLGHEYAGHDDLAAKYAEQAASFASTNAQKTYAYSTLGFIYFKADQPERALKNYLSALQSDPQSMDAAKGIALSLARLGRLQEAYKYATLFEENPSKTLKHIYWAQLYGAAKQFKKAANEYDEALKIEPDSVEALVGYGAAQEALKNYSDAEKAYRKILTNDPDSLAAYYSLGSLHYALKQYDKAESELNKALSLAEEGSNSQSEVYLNPRKGA